MSIERWMDKEDVVHIYNGILLSHKKNEIMPFAATWMDLEIVILSEVSQAEKDKCYMISLICGLKNNWYKWTYLHNRNRVTALENKLMVTKGENGGINSETGIDIYKLLYIKDN